MAVVLLRKSPRQRGAIWPVGPNQDCWSILGPVDVCLAFLGAEPMKAQQGLLGLIMAYQKLFVGVIGSLPPLGLGFVSRGIASGL